MRDISELQSYTVDSIIQACFLHISADTELKTQSSPSGVNQDLQPHDAGMNIYEYTFVEIDFRPR